MMIDTNNPANVVAAVGVIGLILTLIKLILSLGKLIAAAEKVPVEMDGIRDELRESGKQTLKLLASHGERIAVVEAMLNLDDTAQAQGGPMRRRRRGREL